MTKIKIVQNGIANLLPKYDIEVVRGKERGIIGECINAGQGWFVRVGGKEYHTTTLAEAGALATERGLAYVFEV